MSNEERRREEMYQITMSMARNMLQTGIITANEYEVVEDHFVSKYSPVTGTLLTSLSLT